MARSFSRKFSNSWLVQPDKWLKNVDRWAVGHAPGVCKVFGRWMFLFVFELTLSTGQIDGQTDGRTDRQIDRLTRYTTRNASSQGGPHELGGVLHSNFGGHAPISVSASFTPNGYTRCLKKVYPWCLIITLANWTNFQNSFTNWFVGKFHHHAVCCYTTLWKLKIQKM